MTPDYDSPWKDLLDRFFEEYMAFFFPAAHAQIDWTSGFEFLDKELQKITADAAIGRRAVDKLVKVRLKTGPNIVAIIHNEVQGEREPDFEERIYVYHFRISDRFNERVATFVTLTDDNRSWRPSRFIYELLGTKVTLVFSVVKLLDYRGKWYERGYDERTIIDLFRFLDWLMFLPGELQRTYRNEVERYEEEKKMPYVTTIERMGIEQGRVEGRLEDRLETTTDLLQQKFGTLDENIESRLHELTYEQLKQLTTVLLQLDSLDDLRNWLQQLNELPLQA